MRKLTVSNVKKTAEPSGTHSVGRFLLKTAALIAGAVTVISAYKYYDVGNNENISLQCPVSSITAADLSAAQSGNLSPTPSVNSDEDNGNPEALTVHPTGTAMRRVSYNELRPRMKSDSRAIDSNTYKVTSYGDSLGNPEELIDITEFTHDGNPYWVSATLANVRSGPGTENDIVCSISADTRVIRISYGSEWSYIRTEDRQTGYILSSLLTDTEPEGADDPEDDTVTPDIDDRDDAAEPTAAPTQAPTDTPTPTPTPVPAPEFTESEFIATVYASCELNVRTGPGTDRSMVTVLSPRDSIDVVAVTSNGWYKTSDGLYVKAELTWDSLPEPTATPAPEPVADNPGDYQQQEDDQTSENNDGGEGETATEPEADQNSEGGDSSASEVAYNDFASYCLQFVGTPYEYGRASPSAFDCSGFVSYVMANYYGISLPHNAAEIALEGTAVDGDSVQCGDVLCHDYNSDGYIDHVSLYIGNGTCIHASNSRQGVITSAYPMGSVVTIRRFL